MTGDEEEVEEGRRRKDASSKISQRSCRCAFDDHNHRSNKEATLDEPREARRLKALVWFWLIDETLSAHLVYQGDYGIGSTTPSDEAMTKIMTMMMAW